MTQEQELSAQLATYFAINRDASQSAWHELLQTLDPLALGMIHSHIDSASPVGAVIRKKRFCGYCFSIVIR